MRIRLLLLPVLLAAVFGTWAAAPEESEASLIHASVYCQTAGGAEVTFHWQRTPGASMQFVDISTIDNGFQPGTYAGAGPLGGDQSSYRWPGILRGVRHFWRVTALTPDGWIGSETGSFMPCAYTDAPLTQCNDIGPPFLSPNTQTPELGEGVTFLFDEGVAVNERYFFVRGIAEARRFLLQNLGKAVDRPFCVDVRQGTNEIFGHNFLAIAVGHRVLAFAGSTAWLGATERVKISTVVHEYVHVLQAEIANQLLVDEPQWILEGVATLIEFRAMDAANIFSLDQARSEMGLLGRYDSVRGLPELTLFSSWEEFCSGRGFCYSLAWLAAEHMLNGRPISSLRTYYELQGRGFPWWAAFELAFGWDVLQFFDSFEKHRRDLYER